MKPNTQYLEIIIPLLLLIWIHYIAMEDEPVLKRDSTFPLFSKHFSTHPQDVVEYFQTMRKQMEDFIDAFRKRIQVQITYSKNLQSVSKVLDKYIKPGTELSTSYICSAFKVEHEQRSRQALELAESLKTEIEAMCSEYLKNETATLKRMEKDIKKFYKDGENYSDNHGRALESFQGINREMEQMIITKNIMRYTTGMTQDKKVKLIGKASESIKQNKEYQKLYINSVKQYNLFVGAYNKEITVQLDQAQNLIRQQVIMQGDCLRKLIVAEVSMFKNIEYDLLNISKQMEHLDTQKDVEAFVEEQKNNPSNRIIIEEKKDKEDEPKRTSFNSSDSIVIGSMLEEKRIVGKSILSQSLFYVEQEYFSWMLSNKRNKKLRDTIGNIWRMLKNDQKTAQKVQVQETKEEAATSVEQNAETKHEQPNKEAVAKEETRSKTPPINGDSKSWSEQLKQVISTFKIMHPPNYLTPSDKKDRIAAANIDKIYDNYIQITSIIALLWNSEQIDIQTLNNKLIILEGYMAEHHLYRLAALIFIQQYRLQHEVVIKSSNNAKICGKIVRAVLKESQKKIDVFVIRSILALVFTFYWIQDKSKKLLYQIPEVYQCEIWKKNDFWQAAIFQTTFEQMALFTIQKGETQAETVLRQKNIIFSQLASFCHYMVMLGITSKNVRLTVGRYCRLYDMTEQQNKDLSKMINNTLKQYKELAYALTGKAEKEKSVIND